jgi:hypothetical protein
MCSIHQLCTSPHHFDSCSSQVDTRNLLNIPRSRSSTFLGSHTLDLAVASRVLIAVNSATIFEYAFPCCRKGLACCPPRSRDCCAHWRVHGWLAERLREGKEDVRDFTRTRWYDGGRYTWAAAARMGRVHVTDRHQFRNLTNGQAGMTKEQQLAGS